MSDAHEPGAEEPEKASLRPLLWVALLAYFILASYGLCRSGVDSLLQDRHGSDAIKYGYGLVALSVTLVVAIYARAAARYRVANLMRGAAALSGLLLVALLLLVRLELDYITYALYVWKEIYVVILVELVWTLANSAFKHSTAVWAYGFFCVAGTAGDVTGTFISQSLSVRTGTWAVLWLVLVALAFVGVTAGVAARACGSPAPPEKTDLKGAWDVLRRSRAVQLLLILIGTTQIVTALIDFNYTTTVAEHVADADLRTAYYNQVQQSISFWSLGLQLGSGVFVTVLGLRALVLLLPIVLGLAMANYAFHPGVASMIVLKVANKSIDYSLFRTSKELLYRPLSYLERTQGKAVVDVFGYRVAKGGASMLILGMASSVALVTLAASSGIAIWLVLAVLLARRARSD